MVEDRGDVMVSHWGSFTCDHFPTFQLWGNFGKTVSDPYPKVSEGDYPGSSVVKISPSNARGTGSIPGWGAKIPHVSWPKNQNVKQKQIVTNSIKTLKMVRIKKKISKAKRACHPFFPFAARTKYQGQCHIVLLFYGLSKCLPWETAPEK